MLEDQLASLEREVAECKIQDREDSGQTEQSQPSSKAAPSSAVDDQAHPDLIRLDNGGDAHFLGVSSGKHKQ